VLFSKPKPLLPDSEQEQIVAAIRASEARTTGEIRVFVESHCTYVDPLDRAVEIFRSLSMEKTECRNAIIVYVAIKDQQFALYGDEQIYIKAGGPEFWQTAAEELKKYLRAGKIGEGLAKCIGLLGDALASHFPFDPSIDKNELPDEIVFGK
jgi:uncharacterized membrane protein